MKKRLFFLPTLLLAPIFLNAGQVAAAVPVVGGSNSAVAFQESATPLKILAVPDIHFGVDNEIAGGAEAFYKMQENGPYVDANGDPGTLVSSKKIEIQDSRSVATGNTWTLKAKLDEDFVEPDSNTSFAGQIKFLDSASSTAIGGTNVAQLIQGATIGKGVEAIVAERTDNSYGTATMTFANDHIELIVPATAELKTGVVYQTTITWTLTDAP